MIIASEQSNQILEGLSVAIIETLQSLSSEHRPLTTSFLSEALGEKDQVKNLLASIRVTKAPESPPPVQTEKSRGKSGPAKNRNTPKKSDEQGSVLRAVVEEQEEKLRLRDFFRRSIVTLTSLVNRNGVGRELSEELTAFRKAVNDCRGIEDLEQRLECVKKAVMASLDEGVGEVAVRGGNGSAAKPRRDACPGREADVPAHLNKLKWVFSNIVSEFDQDLGEEYVQQVSRIRKRIMAGSVPDDITALNEDLLGIIQSYNRTMNEERNQVTDFVAELGNSLADIERQFLNSLTQSEKSQVENDWSFNSLIENQVDEMKRSAQLSSTLAEFKSLVISRLAAIREALEKKRRAAELREEIIHGEMENLQQTLKRMKKEIDQVQEKRKALEKEVLIDQLTGIANRRALKRRLKEEIQRYHRYRQFFSVILFDIDHFKSVNDRFGHWAGDKCLKELIRRVKPMLRDTDFLARWGGEEFVIVFPGTDVESALGVAERLRKAIENTRFVYQKQEIAVTVSVGVTEVKPGDQGLEAIFNRADKAMYQAKHNGRNMVMEE